MSEKNKNHSIFFDGFKGINHALGHTNNMIADNIVNFRIMPDGSLKKRVGFRMLCDTGGDIRAIHTCNIDGQLSICVLISNKVICIDPNTGVQTEIGSVSTTEGEARFFNYRGMLLILDGNLMYKYSEGTFSLVVGHVPTIGKDWEPNVPGEVYEPRNILNTGARITYKIPENSTIFLHTKHPVESVKAVLRNGTPLDSSLYSINEKFQTIDVLDMVEGDKIEIYLVYKPELDAQKEHLYTCRSSALYNNLGYMGVVLCGGDVSNTVFCSDATDIYEKNATETYFPNKDPIYFPEGHRFEIGDGLSKVNAIIPHRDKLLVFTENDVWMISPDSVRKEKIPAVGVNSTMGCVSRNCVTTVNNDTVSIGKNAIWLWSDDPDYPGNCKATCISKEINDELCAHGLSNCGIFYNQTESELWIYSKISSNAWIYNTEVKQWYKYTGISAESMLEINGKTMFTKQGKIFFFDDSLHKDILASGEQRAISSVYTSTFNDFETSDMKNLSSLVLNADLGGEPLYMEFETPDAALCSCILSEEGISKHSTLKKRLSSRRFCNLKFSIISHGYADQRIHSLLLNTR